MSVFHTWSGYLQQVENVINALINHDGLRFGRFGEEKRITFSRQLTGKLEVLGGGLIPKIICIAKIMNNKISHSRSWSRGLE